MEIKRVQALSGVIIEGERCCYEWAVRLVRGKGAEGRAVFEKKRDVSDVLDIDVVFDRMGIVKMKAVMEVVGIGDDSGCQNDRRRQIKQTASVS